MTPALSSCFCSRPTRHLGVRPGVPTGFTVMLIGTNLPDTLGRSQQEVLKGLAGNSGDREQARQNQKQIK